MFGSCFLFSVAGRDCQGGDAKKRVRVSGGATEAVTDWQLVATMPRRGDARKSGALGVLTPLATQQWEAVQAAGRPAPPPGLASPAARQPAPLPAPGTPPCRPHTPG